MILSRSLQCQIVTYPQKTIIILKIRHWSLEISQKVVRMRETPGARRSTVAAVEQWPGGLGVWCVGPQSWESGQGTSHMEPPTPARTQHTILNSLQWSAETAVGTWAVTRPQPRARCQWDNFPQTLSSTLVIISIKFDNDTWCWLVTAEWNYQQLHFTNFTTDIKMIFYSNAEKYDN